MALEIFQPRFFQFNEPLIITIGVEEVFVPCLSIPIARLNRSN